MGSNNPGTILLLIPPLTVVGQTITVVDGVPKLFGFPHPTKTVYRTGRG